MGGLQLDARLEAAASLVRSGAVVADIGTDHGLLICYLAASGRCPRGFACDVRPLPLANARREIARQGLGDRIEALLTDGLDGLESRGITDFLLLGMGGDLIGELVARHPWTRDPSLRFILQPMTKADHLRRGLYRDGFAVTEERAVRSGRFAYTVMAAAYTGENREIDDLFAWTGLIESGQGEAARDYLRRTAARLRKRADGLRASAAGEAEAARIDALIRGIEGK